MDISQPSLYMELTHMETVVSERKDTLYLLSTRCKISPGAMKQVVYYRYIVQVFLTYSSKTVPVW